MFDLIHIEIALIVFLIGVECYLAWETWLQIFKFKNSFNNFPEIVSGQVSTEVFSTGDSDSIVNYIREGDDLTPYDSLEFSLFSTSSNNSNQVEIISTLNSYLINNHGASIDFHIMKEIVDRNIDAVEDAIETKLPSPLYVGLAATMFGIIIGLFSVDFSTTEIGAIKPLIDGVKVAMSASLIGLALTTWLSIRVYKRAKTIVDYNRNEFISLIQTELLPSIMGPGQSGMQALSRKLDDFGRTTKYVVSDLSEIVRNSNTQVNSSQALLNQVENLDLSKVASANLKVFRSLSGMMESFESFPKYYEELNRSLGKTSNLIGNLDVFIKRTENLEVIFQEIKGVVSESKAANVFFSQHIKEFVNYKDSVNRAVSEADDTMKTAMATLESSVTGLFKGMEEKMSSYDETLANAFNKSVESFNQVALAQISSIEEAFMKSQPKFERLNDLPMILEGVNKFNSEYGKEMLISQGKIEKAIDSLSSQMKNFSNVGSAPMPEVEVRGKLEKVSLLDTIVKYAALIAFFTIISYGLHSAYIYWF